MVVCWPVCLVRSKEVNESKGGVCDGCLRKADPWRNTRVRKVMLVDGCYKEAVGVPESISEGSGVSRPQFLDSLEDRGARPVILGKKTPIARARVLWQQSKCLNIVEVD